MPRNFNAGGVDGALGANPAYHIAAHHANFLAGAICKVQLILRSCGSGVGAAEKKEGLERNAAHSSASPKQKSFYTYK